MRITPCDAPLGAVIDGVDLGDRRWATPERARALRSALVEHHVLFVPDQRVDRAQLLALADHFGPRFAPPPADNPVLGHGMDVVSVSPEPGGVLGHGALPSHSDHAFVERPSLGAIAFCVRSAASGGVTSWANLHAAYDALHDDVRAQIHHLGVWADNPWAGPRAFRTTGGSAQTYAPARAPRIVHPVVRVHPESGRRSLYVSALSRGLVEPDGRSVEDPRLLGHLARHADEPRFFVHHTWRPGDLVVWDNRCTNHRRTGFDPASGRTLWRAQIAGERPRGPAGWAPPP